MKQAVVGLGGSGAASQSQALQWKHTTKIESTRSISAHQTREEKSKIGRKYCRMIRKQSAKWQAITVSPYLPVSTPDVNGLNTPIKRQSDWVKKIILTKTQLYAARKSQFTFKDTHTA